MTPQELTARATTHAQKRLKAMGLTKSSLAVKIHQPPSTVAGWFNRRVISLTTLATIAEAIDAHPSALLMSSDEITAVQEAICALNAAGHHGKAEALKDILEGSC